MGKEKNFKFYYKKIKAIERRKEYLRQFSPNPIDEIINMKSHHGAAHIYDTEYDSLFEYLGGRYEYSNPHLFQYVSWENNNIVDSPARHRRKWEEDELPF